MRFNNTADKKSSPNAFYVIIMRPANKSETKLDLQITWKKLNFALA
jgi:hypothetical protein